MEDIEHYNIPVYNFPYDIEEDDEETIADNSELRVRSHILCSLLPAETFLYRLSFPSLSSDPKKKSKSPVN